MSVRECLLRQFWKNFIENELKNSASFDFNGKLRIEQKCLTKDGAKNSQDDKKLFSISS
jgi:hypothetical protein